MNQKLLICFLASSLNLDAQNFQSGLPSENFFSPHALHHASINLLPTFNFTLSTRGNLLTALSTSPGSPAELLKTTLGNNREKNYLYSQAQIGLLDVRSRHSNKEYGFGIAIKSEGFIHSEFNLQSYHKPTPEIRQEPTPGGSFNMKVSSYAAVSYYFSYLKDVSRHYLKNVGFKIELLTGINAIKGQLKSKGLNIPDTNNFNLAIERKGFISRSNKRLLPEEFLPFFKNPGIALSYGLKWQISSKNKWGINLSNFGFIYYSRTVNNLHRGTDTVNLKGEKPFNAYYDSMRVSGKRQNESYYFLPFEINTNFEHTFNGHHSMLMSLTINPLFRTIKTTVSINKKIGIFHFIPSINSINFNKLIFGAGVLRNAKYISWGIQLSYLANTIDMLNNTMKENVHFYNQNNINAGFYMYYNFIKRTKRLTSKNHKLIKSFLSN